MKFMLCIEVFSKLSDKMPVTVPAPLTLACLPCNNKYCPKLCLHWQILLQNACGYVVFLLALATLGHVKQIEISPFVSSCPRKPR